MIKILPLNYLLRKPLDNQNYFIMMHISLTNFISNALEQGLLEHDTEAGIARQVQAQGTESLSEKQSKVFNRIVERFSGLTCNRCQNTIELEEAPGSIDNGGYCSYCWYQVQKDD